MAAGTLVSRILGFVKILLITVAIGVGSVADVFELANQLPNQIYILVAGGVFNAVLVPQIIQASRQKDGGADYVSRLLSLGILGLLSVTVVVVALAGPIIGFMSDGWSHQQLDLGVVFALWCFPQIFFYGLYTVVGQVLNAKEAFGWYMWAPVLNNVVAIAALVVFIVVFGTHAHNGDTIDQWNATKTFLLAGMATLGVVAQALVLFIPLKALNLGLRLKLGWRGIGLGKAVKLSGWVLATGIIANLAFLFLTHVATIPTGYRDAHPDQAASVPGLASLNYSVMLYQLPHGVIGVSVATVLFNRMALSASEDNNQALIKNFSQGLRIISVATVFSAVALIVLAGPVGMMFSGGSPATGALIGQVITILAMGGPFLTISFMMGRMFYAHEDARTPLVVQSLSAVLVIALGFWITFIDPRHIVFAVAALYVGMNVFSVVMYHRALKKWLGDYDVAHIVTTHLRVALASLVAGIGGFVVLHLMGGSSTTGFAWTNQITGFTTVLVGGVVMVLLYLVALKAFRVKEMDGMLSMVRARLGR